MTDPLGNITRYGYDSKHRLTNTVDALSNVTVMTYFTNGLLQSSTLGTRSVSYTYDSFGNPFTVSRTDGGTVTNRYNASGDVTNIIDALGRTNIYTYDKRRLLTSTRDALGFASSNVFDAAGLLFKTVDRNGNTNQTTYTGTYKPATVVLPNGGTNQFRYDSRDWLVSVTDPLGHVTSNRFDQAGRKSAVVDALTNTTFFAFDPNGNVVAQTNALGHVTHYEFDALNRLTNAWDVTDAGTRAVASVFDTASRLTAVRDADGFTTQFQYDALNRKTTVVKPNGTTERFEYNAFGDVTAFVNAAGRRTEMTFDGMSRQRTVTDALTNRVSWTFDLVGNLITRTNANGSVVQFQYNAVNGLQKTIYPGGVTNSYSYDKNGLLTNAVDVLGSSRFAYDRMNWRTQSVSIVGSVTSTVTSVYDLKGNRTRIVYPGGLTVTNTFDAVDRLAAVADWAGRTVVYAYDGLHSPTGLAYPNGANGTFVWDSASRLARVTYSTNGGAFLDHAYTLSPAGDRVREDVNAGLLPTLSPAVQRLTQDPADRLTALYQKTLPDSPAWATNTPTWEANGNMLADGAGLTLTYDAMNRVTNLQSAAVGNRSVFYNACGSPVKRVVNGTNIVDVFDGPRLLMSRTTNGTALIYYLWGNGLIAQIATNGAALYCHADGQGNVLALTGTGGQLTDQWFYSPYGAVLNRVGSTDLPFQWLGSYGVRAEGGGLYRTRYRVYHAGLMRFTAKDPLGLAGGANLFAYCSGNPLALVDPTGLCWESYMNSLGATWNTVSPVLPFYATMPVNTAIQFVGNYSYFGNPSDAANATFNPAYGAIAYGYQGGSGMGVSYYNSGQQLSGIERAESFALSGVDAAATVAIGFAGASALSPSATPTYPPNRGFMPGEGNPVSVLPGTVVDRYGGTGGSFVSPQGTPAAARSLPVGVEDQPLNAYEVVKPFEARAGTVAPWNGQPGLGIQYDLAPQTVQDLIDGGYLEPSP